MQLTINVDLHEAHKAIENICCLGASIKDEEQRKQILELDKFLQSIWAELNKQQ